MSYELRGGGPGDYWGTHYDAESRAHCPGCGTGLRTGEACSIPSCPRVGLPAGDSGDRGVPVQRPVRVRPVSRETAAKLIREAAGGGFAGEALSQTAFHGAPLTTDGRAALEQLDGQCADPVEARALARMRETQRLRERRATTVSEALSWLAEHPTRNA